MAGESEHVAHLLLPALMILFDKIDALYMLLEQSKTISREDIDKFMADHQPDVERREEFLLQALDSIRNLRRDAELLNQEPPSSLPS
jgi:hypothetical protein